MQWNKQAHHSVCQKLSHWMALSSMPGFFVLPQIRGRYRCRKGKYEFGHEKLDVYRAAIEYVGWAYQFCECLKGHRNAKEQLIRASQAIPLNIAEGNGKATHGDRRRYFEIACGSALECGAVQDVLQVCGALNANENTQSKLVLDRIVAMLTKLGQRGYAKNEKSN